MSKSPEPKTRVLVEFDDILHVGRMTTYIDDGRFDCVPTGAPTEGGLALVNAILEKGHKVIIYSERATWADGLLGIKNWLSKHGYPKGLAITSYIPPRYYFVSRYAVNWPAGLDILKDLPQ